MPPAVERISSLFPAAKQLDTVEGDVIGRDNQKCAGVHQYIRQVDLSPCRDVGIRVHDHQLAS
jgi:hypothetical protein